MKQEKFLLHCDNQSAIHLAMNAAYHSLGSTFKAGIIGCEKVEENAFILAKTHIDENGLDILTKILSMEKLVACRQRIGSVDSPSTRVKGEFVV